MTHCQRQHGVGRGDQGPPPPSPSQGGPYLPVLLPKTTVTATVPGRGVPGWGVKPFQTPGSLCALSCAGHNCDPGGG